MYDILIGRCERDLITEVSTPLDNHRTYLADDGHFYTGIDSAESLPACSDECRDRLIAPYGLAHGHIHDGRSNPAVHVLRLSTGDYEDATVYDLHPEGHSVWCEQCGVLIYDDAP